VAFTWNIRTQEGHDAMRDMLAARQAETGASNFQLEGEATEADGVTDAWFTFETGWRGRGHLRLNQRQGLDAADHHGRAQGLRGEEGTHRIKGAEHGVQQGRKSWLERRTKKRRTLGYDEQPYVVIIGGGQGGIMLAPGCEAGRAGHHHREEPAAGDSWRNRYKSLCLHDPVWYDHLPYMPFPDDWPVFAPKDKIGDWLEMYTKVMELNYWGSTTAKKAASTRRRASGRWWWSARAKR
jgi:putative flavoprotein involved in K+ transport